MKTRALRSAGPAALLALLCALSTGGQAGPNLPPPLFDDATLASLLQHIREFDQAMRRGLDASHVELLSQLPRLWHELQSLEDRLQRSLPALREHLEALERELHGPPPVPTLPAGTFMV